MQGGRMKAEAPFITVVMPVRNEENHISAVLDELLLQDYPRNCFEIIVADGMSTDFTGEVVQALMTRDERVKLFPNPRRFPSAGRNIGFRNGKGDVFVVIDGHCRLGNPGYLKAVADCFERSGAECLGRPQPFMEPGEPSTGKAIALARSSRFGHSRNSYIHKDEECYASPVSMGCAYRREVFEKIGYLDESFDACEDVEFNYRVEKAGFKTFFSPKIGVLYYPRESFTQLGRQMIRYGAGRFRFLVKHKEAFRAEMLAPVVFCALLLLGPFLAIHHPLLMASYLLLLFLLLALLAAESLRLGSRYGIRFVARIMAALIITYMGLGLGMAKGAIDKFIGLFKKTGGAGS